MGYASPEEELSTVATNRITPAYRALMQRVEEVLEHIERDPEKRLSISSVAKEIIRKLREELGIHGGRLYESDGDSYRLVATFPDAREMDQEVVIPRTYPPIELCLMRGSVYMEADDPLVDPELEASLGVTEFAAVELDNGSYILGFSVEPGHLRDEILFSLGVVRKGLNRRLREEHMTDIFREARRIQASILPSKAPSFGPFDIAGRSHSMDSVGGDLFDYIPITDRILGLAIADASGHGLPAALQVRDIYTGLRMGLGRDFKIVRTVERLNNIIHVSTLTSRFVSMFYCELEVTGGVIGVNAGHPPPFHLAVDGTVTFFEAGGPVLGPLPNANYDRSFTTMRPGDLIVLYTDGITETLKASKEPRDETSWEGEEYGVERLLAVARENQGRRAEEVIDAIFQSVANWSGDAPAQDDCTVVVVVYPSEETN